LAIFSLNSILKLVKKMKQLSILIITSLLFSDAFAGEQLASKEVLLDNDQVQVVRLTYPAGTESGMHQHEYPNRVVYFVQGGKLELIPEDESKDHQIVEVEDGDTIFMPASTHNVKNIGITQVVIVETEIK
jgi:mannose-6-phosphate isomerase-like protein (cupin superfamily)